MPEQEKLEIDRNIPKLTKTECTVCEIWAEVLEKEKIDLEDNFFEIGGDSLMTMMVMYKVNDNLNIELPPGTIMEAPTLKEFCSTIDSHLEEKNSGDHMEDGLDSSEMESGVI